MSENINYSYWLAMSYWTIEEAALLLCGFNPDKRECKEILKTKTGAVGKVYEILNRACQICELYKYDDKYPDIEDVTYPCRQYTISTYINFWRNKLENIISLPPELLKKHSNERALKYNASNIGNMCTHPSDTTSVPNKIAKNSAIIKTLTIKQLLERWNNRYSLENIYEMASQYHYGIYFRTSTEPKTYHDIKGGLASLTNSRYTIERASEEEKKHYASQNEKLSFFINNYPFLLEEKNGYVRLATELEVEIAPLCESGSIGRMIKEKNIAPLAWNNVFGFVAHNDMVIARAYYQNTNYPFALEEECFVFIDQIERFEQSSEFSNHFYKKKLSSASCNENIFSDDIAKSIRCGDQIRKDRRQFSKKAGKIRKENAGNQWKELQHYVRKIAEDL